MRSTLRLAAAFGFIAAGGLALALGGAGAAKADTCWNHNGSVMRLQAQGNNRWFTYEVPRQGMAHLVSRGTLLFNGVKSGNWYSGTARVFSPGCAPLEYHVEGPVRPDQLQVTVRGWREVFQNCQPTGRQVEDVLVFTATHQC